MDINIRASVKNVPVGVALIAEIVKDAIRVNIEWSTENTCLKINDETQFTTTATIARYLARLTPHLDLYGSTALDKARVDHWITFSANALNSAPKFSEFISYLNNHLDKLTFLVGSRLSLADVCAWAALYGSGPWRELSSRPDCPPNVRRWYDALAARADFAASLAKIPADARKAIREGGNAAPTRGTAGSPQQPPPRTAARKEEGKFVELPGAERGKVVVRFPPEASGYLHIGHAKAALLNQHYQLAFDGKLIMRFDDTNPAKETEEFERVILEDVKLLDVRYDAFSHTSDHFELIMGYCDRMIGNGEAYCDDTDAERMKVEREKKVDSKNRNNGIEANVSAWEEMKRGSARGLRFCVRAKMDMRSANGCMRDPTIYRCKNEPHLRTGHKYKVYPTYDFACPIVDSVEGVTHALRTTEYHDRDEQYYWFLDRLRLRRVRIWEYSRLNMTNTVLSKRKLTWFVNEGIVDGWDDPRFPTVRGVLRRGMTVEGLRQFIIAQGSSKSVVTMEWDKIWAFNKKVIDPIAPRYTALEKDGAVSVAVDGVLDGSSFQLAKHPKNEALGMKTVWTGPNILIDGADAETLVQGENVTFIGWGNLLIRKIARSKDGRVASIEAEPNLDNKDYKKTLKVTWLSSGGQQAPPLIPCSCVYFEHIIGKAVLDRDDDFKKYVNANTKIEIHMLAENELKSLKKGDIVQLQRRGFFICDSPYQPVSVHTGTESPLILFFVPDGHTKELPTLGLAKRKDLSAKESSQSERGKSAEKSPQDEPQVANLADKLMQKLDLEIQCQGDKIRLLKSQKATKDAIGVEVKTLLDLKAQFKKCTGDEWRPPSGQGVKTQTREASVDELDQKIRSQGDRVRRLKTDKAPNDKVKVEVQALLALKAEYSKVAGRDWQPNAPAQVQKVEKPNCKEEKTNENQKEKQGGGTNDMGQADAGSSQEAVALRSKVEAQGEKVRQLKAAKEAPDAIAKQVELLLRLKEEYKKLTGNDLTPTGGAGRSNKGKKEKKSEANKEKEAGGKGKKEEMEEEEEKEKEKEREREKANPNLKKTTRLGLEATKETNLSDWYSQVITKAEMIEYYDVSGCYVLRPWAYHIWEAIMSFFDAEIKKLGVQNCYFPMFVSQAALQKEKTHIADFAPEVAWVTKSGDTDLAEPIAIRPTSETAMYPSFAKWIKSHRDLPLKLNQWNSVVRWEFKHPQPFLRTREFLWQEGHTAYATRAEAEEEVHVILELYRRVYEELLAIPVIPGRKTEKEKFAGGDFTTTVEAYVAASGRGLQGATSHHLGQNFSKMFQIQFEDPESADKDDKKLFAYQNSWGLSTRTIGAMVMVHADNAGLVLPPRVACVQVVIVPCGITASTSGEDAEALLNKCREYEAELKKAGLKCQGDYRSNYSPGWKFNHWELKGVPVRLEVGPRDVSKGQFVAVRRDNGEKLVLKESDAAEAVVKLIEAIHGSLFNRAKRELDDHLVVAHEWTDFYEKLDDGCVIQAPFCGRPACEDDIKKASSKEEASAAGFAGSASSGPSMGAKTLCIPFNQPAEIHATAHCINGDCQEKPKFYALFGRSY